MLCVTHPVINVGAAIALRSNKTLNKQKQAGLERAWLRPPSALGGSDGGEGSSTLPGASTPE